MRREIISPEGFRQDGRRPEELRRSHFRTKLFQQADGSAYVEQGNTQCLVTVSGPREPLTRAKSLPDRAAITVEYSVASFSSGERKGQMRTNRAHMEVAASIQATFEQAVMTQLFPRSEITICVQMVQLDGSALATAINAVSLAIIDAGIPVSDYVTACTAGYVGSEPVLDLNYLEESAGMPQLTLALLPRTRKIVTLAMEQKLHIDHLEPTAEMCEEGCLQMYKQMNAYIGTASRLATIITPSA